MLPSPISPKLILVCKFDVKKSWDVVIPGVYASEVPYFVGAAVEIRLLNHFDFKNQAGRSCRLKMCWVVWIPPGFAWKGWLWLWHTGQCWQMAPWAPCPPLGLMAVQGSAAGGASPHLHLLYLGCNLLSLYCLILFCKVCLVTLIFSDQN